MAELRLTLRYSRAHIAAVAAVALLLIGTTRFAVAADDMARTEAKPLVTNALPERLFYHPAVGADLQCDVSLDLTVETPEDPSARLDFNNISRNIAWTLKIVGAAADRTLQKQTLTEFSFRKDGKEFSDFDSGAAGSIKLLMGRIVEVDMSPSMKILDARVDESQLSMDSSYLRQFLSFNYASDLFPDKGIPLTAGSTWNNDALLPLPGISDDFRIPINARLTEIRKVGAVDCALVSVDAHDNVSDPDAASRSISNIQVDFSGEFCFAIADGVPVYGETELDIHAALERQGAQQPIDITVRTRQTARPAKVKSDKETKK